MRSFEEIVTEQAKKHMEANNLWIQKKRVPSPISTQEFDSGYSGTFTPVDMNSALSSDVVNNHVSPEEKLESTTGYITEKPIPENGHYLWDPLPSLYGKTSKIIYVCKTCGSSDVAKPVWTDINNKRITYERLPEVGNHYCTNCECATEIIDKKDYNPNAEQED